MAIKINEMKQTQASTETDETKDTSHLVNANKKLKTPLTSRDVSLLGKLYMTLFERLEPQQRLAFIFVFSLMFQIFPVTFRG